MAGCLDPESCLRLWASVVLASIDDLSSRVDLVRETAERWFTSPNAGVGSFLWCCDRLGIDPDAARSRIGHGLVEARAHVRARYSALRRLDH